MSGLLAATEPARKIVVERGGPAWWVPAAAALFVALIAALASYYATWRFKRGDVNRENAFRAVELVDEAERMTPSEDAFVNAGGAQAASRLLERALVRAQPLGDWNLFDRFFAAHEFAFFMGGWKTEPSTARYWLGEAIAEVQQALVPYLSAPRLFRRSPPPRSRAFPPFDELTAMAIDGIDPQKVIDRLEAWSADHQST